MKYRPVFLFRISPFFTLIELLVTVSIVSIISSISLASLQTARDRAIDSRTKEAASSIRSQAAIYQSTNDTYGIQATSTGVANCRSGVFADERIQEILITSETLGAEQVSCVSTGTFYSLSIPLKSNPTKSWCVDSLGGSRIIDGTIATEPCTISTPGGGESVVRCPASGGCVEALDGSSCTTYSTSTSASCSSVAQTSVCVGGSWNVVPYMYASCSTVMNSCTAPDTSVVAHGGTWSGYSTNSVACGSSCPAKNTVITCNDGSWSGTAYNICTVASCLSCAASGGCALTAHGGTCTTYSSSAPSGAACSTVSRTSTCSDGTWSITPYSYSSCTSGCAASGACSAAVNGGTCSSNNTSSVAFGNTCPSNFTSTCSNGSWSPAPGSYSSCSVDPAGNCPASGACGVTAHGGSCTSYSTATAGVGSACSSFSRISTCNNGSWSTTPYTNASCANPCTTSGACAAATSGTSCGTTYQYSSRSGALCSAASNAPVCSNGSWSVTPYANSSCTSGCAASGACSAAANGSTCNTYSVASTVYPTACPSATASTCNGASASSLGSWSPAPYTNASCVPGTPTSCPASGGCGVTANGGSCTTYSTSSVTSPAACTSKTTVCDNGNWKTAIGGTASTPYANASCSVIMRTCTAPDSSIVNHNGTWNGYLVSSVACGSSCPAKNTVITCNDGSWSGTAYNTCTVNPCGSCAASGGCGLTTHGGSCTSYSTATAAVGSSCSLASKTTVCDNTTWKTAIGGTASTPYTNGSCANPCATSGACAAATSGTSCGTTYQYSSRSGALCSSASNTPVCSNGSWSVTPYANSSCTSGCAASGACSAAVNGTVCTTNSSSGATCPTTCPANTSSTCNGASASSLGSWSVAPATYASCTQTSGNACSKTSTGNNCGATNTTSGTYNASCVCGATTPTVPANCPYTTGTSYCSGSNVYYNGGCNGTACHTSSLVTSCSGTTCSGGNVYTYSGCSGGACTGSVTQTCSYGCSAGACIPPTVVFGPVIYGIQNTTCTGYSSPASTAVMPVGKTMVLCTYDYNSPYNNFAGGAPHPSWNASTRTCSMVLDCLGGVSGGACYQSGWCNQYQIRARLEYY